MTRYRFLDGLGDVVDEDDFPDHGAALARARDGDLAGGDLAGGDLAGGVQRVEFRGPDGDWRWAGPLLD